MLKRFLVIPTSIFAFVVGCTGTEAATTGSTQSSALSGTVSATAATNCATTLCSCVRNGGTTCLEDARACIEAGTSSADASTTSDGGSPTKDGGAHSGRGGKCKSDGTIDSSSIAACLTALEECAKSDAGIDTCVVDAVTCVTASSTDTAEAGAAATVK